MTGTFDIESLRMASRIYSFLAAIQATLRTQLGEELSEQGVDLEAGAFSILRVIDSTQGSGVTTAELADYLMLPRTSARRLIDRLARRDLVDDRPGETDRRVRRWSSTEVGRELLAQLPEPFAEGRFAQALQGLSRYDRDVLTGQLPRLLDGLRLRADQATGIEPDMRFESTATQGERPGALFDLWLGIVRQYRMIREGQTRFLSESTGGALETPAYMALYRVHETPSSASDVSSFLRVEQNTALRIVDRLESAGLVTRSRNQSDRRQVLISATERGVELVEAVPPFDPNGAYVEAVGNLPAGGAELSQALNALVNSFLKAPVLSLSGLDSLLDRVRERASHSVEGSVEPERFRQAMSRFLTGVAVVTIGHDGVQRGITVNSLTSVSLDPPVLLVCFDRRSPALERLKKAGKFAANILAEHQSELASRFGKRESDENPHSLDEGAWIEVEGVPVLRDSLASVVCDVQDSLEAGTHTIVLAAPREVIAEPDGERTNALGYWKSDFFAVAHEHQAADGDPRS